MIIIKLTGGLGNQMFQYAFGRAYAIKHDSVMKPDVTDYPKQTLRSYGLSAFNIREDLATPEEVRALKYPYGFLSKAWRLFSKKILRRFYLDYHPELLEFRKDAYFDGFFQSEKYFLEHQEIIRREFTLLSELSHDALEARQKIEEAPLSVSLHVRRGDYHANAKVSFLLGVCSPEYYKDAADMITSGFPEATFFIFSDDIEWVKANLILPYPTVYVSKPSIKDYEEMILMSHCDHHIIANSSFSWWGAWLNQSPDKVVVAPKKWTNTRLHGHPNIIPETWTQK